MRLASLGTVGLFLSWFATGQNGRPDFTGIWRSVAITRGQNVESTAEIKQTPSSFSIKQSVRNGALAEWSVYPTNGTVTTTKFGWRSVEKSAHWEGNKLILEETGPGNAPWQRSTQRRIITFSKDSKSLSVSFYFVRGRASNFDYRVEYERVDKEEHQDGR